MNTFTYLATILIAALLLVTPAKASESRPLKDGDNVLFIGNSLTGTKDNGVPGLTNAALASVKGPQMNGHRVQIWAQTLKTHWEISPENDKSRFKDGQFRGASTLLGKGIYKEPYTTRGYVPARDAVAKGTPEGKPWDIVVLQCFSGADSVPNSIEGEGANAKLSGDFFDYANRFATLARERGATPVLYMRTINRRSDYRGGAKKWAADARILEQNYHALGKHLGIDVVPVGEVVHDLTASPPMPSLPDGWLYGDGIHPNSFGRAVWGYTFAAVMTRRSPLDMSIEVSDYAIGKQVGDIAITIEIDRAIRQRVHDIVGRYYTLTPAERTR